MMYRLIFSKGEGIEKENKIKYNLILNGNYIFGFWFWYEVKLGFLEFYIWLILINYECFRIILYL